MTLFKKMYLRLKTKILLFYLLRKIKAAFLDEELSTGHKAEERGKILGAPNEKLDEFFGGHGWVDQEVQDACRKSGEHGWVKLDRENPATFPEIGKQIIIVYDDKDYCGFFGFYNGKSFRFNFVSEIRTAFPFGWAYAPKWGEKE